MLRSSVIFLICLAFLGTFGAQVNIAPEPDTTTVKPSTSPKPITTTTNKPTTPTTTTTTKTTTTVTTTTSTPKPTTTSTTTTMKPTTTPKPTPVPTPTAGTWVANYTGTNRTCLLMHFAIQIEIVDQDNSTTKINLPVGANATGNCSTNEKESLTLQWGNNSIVLTFDKTNTSKYELNKMDITLTDKNAAIHHFVNNQTEFSTPLQNSYKCNKEQKLNLTCLEDPKTVAYLLISDVQIQAFRNVTGHNFDSAFDCESAGGRDVVPIVVGCVLAILVILVLVGFLFGRRCYTRGYLSMFSTTKTEADYIPMKNISCFN